MNIEIKEWADFAISPFYQRHLKPYFNEVLQSAYNDLDVEPKTEFDSLKRDLTLYGFKKFVRIVTRKIDEAPERMNKELRKIGERTIIKKLN